MKQLLSILLLLLLLAACEEDVGSPGDTGFEEKLVVVAAVHDLGNDSSEVLCRVSRTVPLSEEFILEKTLVRDARVVLQNHDSWNIPAEEGYRDTGMWDYETFGLYTHRAVVPSGAGSTVNLVVEGRGHNAHATVGRVGPAPVATMQTEVSESYTHLAFRFDCSSPSDILFIPVEGFSSQLDAWVRLDWGSYFREAPCVYVRSFSSGGLRGYSRFRYAVEYTGPEHGRYIDGRYGGSGDDFWGNGTNPPFNVTGGGIGFFWWEQRTDWVEFSL